MRISDWSSDVCSSDLVEIEQLAAALELARDFVGLRHEEAGVEADRPERRRHGAGEILQAVERRRMAGGEELAPGVGPASADERREGKVGVSTCRARWSTSQPKTNTRTQVTSSN